MKRLVIFLLSVFLVSCSNKELEKKERISNESNSLIEIDNDNQIILGNWEVSSKLMNLTYTIKIIKEENTYKGIKNIEDKITEEILNYSNNRFLVEGNNFGKYYIIDELGNLKIFEEEENVADFGWTIKKLMIGK